MISIFNHILFLIDNHIVAIRLNNNHLHLLKDYTSLSIGGNDYIGTSLVLQLSKLLLVDEWTDKLSKVISIAEKTLDTSTIHWIQGLIKYIEENINNSDKEYFHQVNTLFINSLIDLKESDKEEVEVSKEVLLVLICASISKKWEEYVNNLFITIQFIPSKEYE